MALKYLYVPSAVQANKAYGVLPNSANADFSFFSRSSAGSRVDKNGFINTGLGLGSEEVTNGGFSSDSNWTKGTGWTIANGVAINQGNDGSQQILQTGVVSADKSYEMTITVVSNEGTGNNTIYIGNKIVSNTNLGVGTYTFQATPTSGSTINIFCSTGGEFSIDNVSVREITEVNTDVPRLDYTGGGCPSLLLEPESTNYIPYSEDFSVANWSAIAGASKEYNVAISPDGTQNASRFNYDGTNGGRVEYASVSNLTSGVTYTFSVYLKSESGNIENVQIGHSTWGLKTVTVTNEWQRFTQTVTSNTTSAYPRVKLDTVGSVLVWGYQLEQQSYATSYIPNYGTAAGVTRSADNAGSTGDLSNVINSSEGVLYVNVAALSSNGSSRRITLNNGTTSNRLIFQYSSTSNQINYYFVVGGTNQCSMSHTLSNAMDYSKVALKYKENDFALWVNGVEVGTENSGNTLSAGTLNSLNFDGATGNYPFYGRCKEIRIYDEALNDAEMVKLTTL